LWQFLLQFTHSIIGGGGGGWSFLSCSLCILVAQLLAITIFVACAPTFVDFC
jgi:hypothetical protein